MNLCNLIAELVSLCVRRCRRRKYVASGVIIREIDQSNVIPNNSAVKFVRSQAEMEALFGSPHREQDKVSIE